MGICDSAQDERQNPYQAQNSSQKNNRGKEPREKTNPQLLSADPNSSRHLDTEEDIDKREQILRRGVKKEIQRMIDDYNEDINEYTFGQNRTLLIEAVIVCPNPAVVDMIMARDADINKAEFQTGNTAIFLSALDLKVDFVAALLKYRPNLSHRNHAQQNIFEFLNFQLFEQRQTIGREMTQEELSKYRKIESMLKNAAGY